jgi:hypothetical protein
METIIQTGNHIASSVLSSPRWLRVQRHRRLGCTPVRSPVTRQAPAIFTCRTRLELGLLVRHIYPLQGANFH